MGLCWGYIRVAERALKGTMHKSRSVPFAGPFDTIEHPEVENSLCAVQ